MPVSESMGEVFVPKNPPTSVVRSVRDSVWLALTKGGSLINLTKLLNNNERRDG